MRKWSAENGLCLAHMNSNLNSNVSVKRPRTTRRASLAQGLLSTNYRTVRKTSMFGRTVHTRNISVLKGRRQSSIIRIAGYKPGK